MKKRFVSVLVTLLCVMLGALGFAACDDGSGKNEGANGGGNSGAQTVAVESVTLNKTELTLEIGGEETLTATVTPDNATEKTVAWSSDNTAVATVANGKVTAVAAGTATVTATADGKSATCSVTVIMSAVTSVAGKTFVFKDVTCQSGDADAETMAQMKAANNGAVLTFGTDGTCVYTMPAQSAVQKLTYEQDRDRVNAVLVEFKINGEDMPVSGSTSQQFTVENGRIVLKQSINNVLYVYVFELQTAE